MHVIDADTHMSTARLHPLGIGADELVKRMDDAGVERALVWLQPPYDRNIRRENRGVYEATQRFPDRLIGFGWANPRLGRKDAEEEISRCIEEYGFYGVKFNGAQDDYKIDEPEVVELVGKVVESGKVVAFHIGADSYENTHPFRFAKLASQYPEGTFLMVHMGGAALPPLDKAAIEVATNHPNVYLVGSAIPDLSILDALRTLGPDRLCFGSDTPFRLMRAELAKYEAILRDFDPETRQKVLGGNLAGILGFTSF